MTSEQRYKCRVCGYIYSPLRGEPHNGIPAGTAFEDLPDTYICPICGMELIPVAAAAEEEADPALPILAVSPRSAALM